MIAAALLFSAFAFFPQYPVISALCLWGAFESAKRVNPYLQEMAEMTLFYLALLGVAVGVVYG